VFWATVAECATAVLELWLTGRAGWDEGILGGSGNEGMSLGEKATLTISRYVDFVVLLQALSFFPASPFEASENDADPQTPVTMDTATSKPDQFSLILPRSTLLQWKESIDLQRILCSGYFGGRKERQRHHSDMAKLTIRFFVPTADSRASFPQVQT
jgi:hypothetical protein